MGQESAFSSYAVATDIAVFTVRDGALKLLLIKRKIEPFKAMWALPGGFVQADESLEECAMRELEEEANIAEIYLEQLYAFGAPDRDPRERVVSIAYFALVPSDQLDVMAGSDASDAAWYAIDALPPLAFDHREIVEMARERLAAKLDYSTIGLLFMPEKFTLSDVQTLYEIVSGQQKDKRNFRKWLLGLDVIEETGNKKSDGAFRPAKLYRLKGERNVEIIR